MILKKNQIIQLSIERLSNDGNGLGRHEGQVVFVANTAPGDVAEVQIVRLAKTHAFGKLLFLHEESPLRAKPDCPVGTMCGGCCFRHLQYAAELSAKEQFVADAFDRILKKQVTLLPILPSPTVLHYRNKVQYPVAQEDENSLVYGFYANRSHRPVPCDNCLLQPPLLNNIVKAAVQLAENAGIQAYNETTQKGLLRHICLRQSNKTKNVLLTFVINGNSLPHSKEIVDGLCKQFPEISGMYVNTNTSHGNVIFGPHFKLLYGQSTLDDTLCDVPQMLGPNSFSQVNSLAAEQLFQTARQFAGLKPEHSLLDLYCGTGVIGLSMAKDCKELVGIEIVSEAVESARQSALKMGLKDVRFLCMDAAQATEQLLQEGFCPDVALLDPPRKGCGEAALQPLLKMSPKKIVMISCNPATMARDLAILTQSDYEIEKVQAVDMFPRTRHVECITLLKYCGEKHKK